MDKLVTIHSCRFDLDLASPLLGWEKRGSVSLLKEFALDVPAVLHGVACNLTNTACVDKCPFNGKMFWQTDRFSFLLDSVKTCVRDYVPGRRSAWLPISWPSLARACLVGGPAIGIAREMVGSLNAAKQ